MKVPSVVLVAHRAIGLAVGVLLLVIGLTGSAIVFWERGHQFSGGAAISGGAGSL